MTQKSENGRRRMLGTSSILTATNSVLPTAGSTGDDVLSILLEGNTGRDRRVVARPGTHRITRVTSHKHDRVRPWPDGDFGAKRRTDQQS